MFKKTIASLLATTFLMSSFVPCALANTLSTEQQTQLKSIVEKEKANLTSLSPESVKVQFSALSGTIYGHSEQFNALSDEKKVELAIRYSALREMVSDDDRKEVYTSLFGDRENSPYYGKASAAEFESAADTGAGLFMLFAGFAVLAVALKR